MSSTPEVILFNLGGVLQELDQHPIHPDWIADCYKFDLQDWIDSDIAIAFEQGRLSPTEFADVPSPQ